jgi:hypothetical protein
MNLFPYLCYSLYVLCVFFFLLVLALYLASGLLSLHLNKYELNYYVIKIEFNSTIGGNFVLCSATRQPVDMKKSQRYEQGRTELHSAAT